MKILKLLLLLLIASPVFAQSGIPQRPSPPRLVNNLSKQFPDFLSSSETAALENKLVEFNKQTSNQIVVLIVDDFAGMDANSFGVAVGRAWGVGQGDLNNGIIVLVNPTGQAGHREPPYIVVGYGLEGAIPDITAKHICEDEIAPRFRDGKYFEGLDAGTDVLMKLAKGEISSDKYNKQHEPRASRYLWIIAIVIIIVVLMRRRGGGGRGFGAGMATGYFIGGGGFGRHSGGFGGGGGGFGGFGGGSFGGGGGGGGKW